MWSYGCSRVSQFVYLAKKKKVSERYTADFLYKVWILVRTKPLYRNAKLIEFWRNASVLHNTGLEFCKATVNSIKRDSLFVLRFYGPINPMGSCRARSVYLATRLLGRLSPLSG